MQRDIHQPTNAQVKAELFFGANKPDGSIPVTDNEFDNFLADHVTRHFSGFSVSQVDGYWKGKSELTRVLTILADDSNGFRNQVRMIAEQYKTRFAQEAVAYAFTEAQFALDCWPYGPIGAYHKEGLGY